MPRPSKQPKNAADPDPSPAVPDAVGVVQVKVWLLGISPMVWRRLLVPDTCTLHELHGVIQVAMGWEGIHLYQFCLRSRRYGSWEVSASSPDVTLAGLDDASSWDALEDLHTMADILREVVLENRPEVLRDEDKRWQLENALERAKARERAKGSPFVQRSVNARLRKREHLVFMHQQW